MGAVLMLPPPTPYSREITRGTELLLQDPRTVFISQSLFGANGLARSLAIVPPTRRVDVPVFEETQLGMSIGMALAGLRPVTVYTRMNFLLLAMNQLVNQLDRLPDAGGGWTAKLLIRVVVGASQPLFPGPQHTGDFTDAIEKMLRHVRVERLREPTEVLPAYERYLALPEPALMVEYGDLY